MIHFLQELRDSGFSDDAMVKFGKSTGQQIVMVVYEDKEDVGAMVPVPRMQNALKTPVERTRNPEDPSQEPPKFFTPKPMWPETE